jgi:hypothetical protein
MVSGKQQNQMSQIYIAEDNIKICYFGWIFFASGARWRCWSFAIKPIACSENWEVGARILAMPSQCPKRVVRGKVREVIAPAGTAQGVALVPEALCRRVDDTNIGGLLGKGKPLNPYHPREHVWL